MFVYRRSLQFQQTCQIYCVKSLNNSCSDLKKDTRVKIVQKNSNYCSGGSEKNFDNSLTTTKFFQKSNLFPFHSKSHNDKRNMFSWNNCLFFKTSLRTGRMQPRRTCRTFPTNSPTNFCVEYECYKKVLHFRSETQFFIECSSVHVKCIFDDCAERLELNMETFIPKSQNWWEKSKLLEKISKLCYRIRKRSPVVNKQGCAWSKNFPL